MEKRLEGCHIITIINQKGGVGKTSTCTAMAALLGMAKYRCLVIDNDSQANTTATLLPNITAITKSIVDIFHQEKTPTKEEVLSCIYKTPYQGVDIIPARPEHEQTDDYLYTMMGRKAIYKLLERAIRHIKSQYDFIFIDTHPELGNTVQNALCCSDYILIPVKPDGYSYQGVAPIVNRILDISSDEDLNPNLQLLGVFLTCAEPRTAEYKEFYDYYKNTFADDFIPVSVRLDRAVSSVCNYWIPLPYLLGSSEYQVNRAWKGIYDYIELMRYVEMITDEDYAILRSTFEILEKHLAISIPNDCYEQPYISRIIPTLNKINIRSDDGNQPHMTYGTLLDLLNDKRSLRDAVQSCLISIGSSSKNIRFCADPEEQDLKYSFVRLSALKLNQEGSSWQK